MTVTALRERKEPKRAAAPLAETEYASRVEPCAFVIFGATGDLARRKLLPALVALSVRGLLPERLAVVGLAREKLTTEEWQARMGEAVREHARDDHAGAAWRRLAERAHYTPADFDDEHVYRKLSRMLARIDQDHGTQGNRLYYLAAPPGTFPAIVEHLGDHVDRHGWLRLVVEKPFGHDLVSARALNELLHRRFDESEILRIDHYLGKETVQNLLVLRFANGIFEPLWNRQLVDHVQITVAEAIGIEGRAEYYEQAGAIRDIFQNHLLQLLALTAMEPPIDFSPEQVRNEKAKVLRAMRTPGPRHVVRGQYGHGFVDGEEVAGYREEPGVPARAMTDTYVAAKLFVDNWRWADTPFYLRTGKRLARHATSITVQFK
ncbi:MAG: glucose-6-phosphate dehydrogenase, partial [Gaiellaceae bacterium]